MNISDPQGPGDGSPRELDAHFYLLDRQIVDPEDRMVAKVDDLEVQERFDGLAITALLTGPGALGPRLGGRLGEWMVAIWRRLRPDVDPRPGRIPIEDVTGIDSAVHVGRLRCELDVEGFERWVDATVVSRLPFVHGQGPDWRDAAAADPPGPVRRFSALIGHEVVNADGHALGRVSDARLRRDPILDVLVVTELIVNRERERSRFGYERPGGEQSRVVRHLLRLGGSPATGRIAWADVDRVDWDARRVHFRSMDIGGF